MNLGVDTNIQTAAIHKALGDIKGTKDGTWKIPTFEGLALGEEEIKRAWESIWSREKRTKEQWRQMSCSVSTSILIALQKQAASVPTVLKQVIFVGTWPPCQQVALKAKEVAKS